MDGLRLAAEPFRRFTIDNLHQADLNLFLNHGSTAESAYT